MGSTEVWSTSDVQRPQWGSHDVIQRVISPPDARSCGVATRQETNVRLPLCAVEALERIAARRGVSRDEAVRQVLDEHVVEQEAREPDDRLTHISTVLRYPAPPRSRSHERVDRPLRLRLVPGVAERARAVSLRLPGQSQRAHRDYQARLLTDAVITAIAAREPFTDEFLGDLLPLLRHAAALGLWQLAVAVTSTAAELAVLDEAENLRSRIGASPELNSAERRLLLIAEALDDEVSWHSSARFVVATNLAREYLTGDRAVAEERVFYEQGTEWNERRLDLRHSTRKAVYFRDVPDWHDWSGRGGTAVWRAERRVEVQDFEDWLVSPPRDRAPRSRVVSPPGWLVRIPAEWDAHVLPRNRDVPARFTEWIEAGRVMVFPRQGRQVVWPLRAAHTSPVPGVEPLVAVARELRPDKVVEFIESILVEWGTRENDEEPDEERDTPTLLLPVDKAFEFGYVTAEERRHAMADARAHTKDLPHWPYTGERTVQDAVPTADTRFRLLVTRRRKRRTAKPMWLWPGSSVAAEIGTNTSAKVIGWLATNAHRMAQRELHRAMEQAWHDGFDHHPNAFWHPNALPDTPM